MKRRTALLLAAALSMVLSACGGGAEPGPSPAGGADAGHVHTEEVIPAVDPTCTQTGLTEGTRCSECGEVLVEQEVVPALGHTTETGTCERCGQSFGLGEMKYYIDEFQQPVEGEWYIANNDWAVGTFSNSATTNSPLSVLVTYVYHGYICFILYEYGNSQVKNVWDTDTYSITMRTPDGTDHEMKGYLYESGDRIIVEDAGSVSDILTALSGQGEVSFFLRSGRFETTSYLFSIEASNFAEVYSGVSAQ